MTMGTPMTCKSSRQAAWSFSWGTLSEPTYVSRTVAARLIMPSSTWRARSTASPGLIGASPESKSKLYSSSSSSDNASCLGVSTYSVLGSMDNSRRSVASRSAVSASPPGLSSSITASSRISQDSSSSVAVAASLAADRARSSASSAVSTSVAIEDDPTGCCSAAAPASTSSTAGTASEASSSPSEASGSGSSVSSSGDPRDARVISSTHSSYRLRRDAVCDANNDT